MRRSEAKRDRAFTLIELMIVVAILGLLASVALPSYLEYIYRSKSAEVPVLMREIANTQVGFFLKPRVNPVTGDLLPACYLQAAMNPSSVSANRRQWETTDSRWAVLGFAPSTPTYYSYFVAGDVDAAEGICSTPNQAGMSPAVHGQSYAVVGAAGDLRGSGVIEVIAQILSPSAYAVVGPSHMMVGGVPLNGGSDMWSTHSLRVMTLYVNERGSPAVRSMANFVNPDYFD